MKQNIRRTIKKILVKLHLWNAVLCTLEAIHFIKCRIYSFQSKWYAREFAPLFGRNRLYTKFRYNGTVSSLSHSQYGQDIYVYEKIFNRQTGFFVEIGANDPIKLSNTYSLEKLGWKGISFEPISDLCKKWETERTTKCYPYLIGESECMVDFEEISGPMSVLSSVAGSGRRLDTIKADVTQKRMRRLECVLQEEGIQKIDILFLDAEGYELNILKTIDFTSLPISCVVVENPGLQYGETAELRRLMVNNGYTLKAHIGGDDVFILA